MTDPNTDPNPAPAQDQKDSAPAPAPAPAPASPTPEPVEEPVPGKARKIHRFQIGVNVIIQITILLFILLMLNYLGFRHYERWDFSRSQKYTLSQKTTQVLDTIEDPVKVIMWFDQNDRIFPDVLTLLTEYQMRSKGKLKLELVNPLRDPNRSRELQAQYKFRDNEDVIVLDNGRNTKFVYGADMVELEPLDPLMAQVKMDPPIKSFMGEQKLTSALQEIGSEKQPKIYITQGHREPEFMGTEESPSPIRVTLDYLGKENINLQPLALISQEEVPKDADALIIVGPQYDLTKRELVMLEDYWERGGSLTIFLDPNYPCRNLSEFCARRGITPQHDRVLKTSMVQNVAFVYVDVTAQFIGKSAVTQALEGTQTKLVGGSQSLKLDETRARQENLELAPLLLADADYWGERDYPVREGDPAPTFTKGVDNEAPLFLAASAEQVDGELTRRLVVAGNSAMVEDKTMSTAQNLQLIINSANWSLDRNEILGIPPKNRNDFRINLSDRQKAQLWFLCILAVPAIAAVIGLLVWLRRRK